MTMRNRHSQHWHHFSRISNVCRVLAERVTEWCDFQLFFL